MSQGVRVISSVPTGHFRRTRRQSPRLLMVGTAKRRLGDG